MVQIFINLLLFVLWLVLTAGLTVGVSQLGAENPNFGGGASVLLWLVGELVILAPLLRIIWRDRRLDFERS